MNTIKYNIVKTADKWAMIQGMGDYEKKFKNGELWYFNGEYWYLSHLELDIKELKELVEWMKGEETI